LYNFVDLIHSTEKGGLVQILQSFFVENSEIFSEFETVLSDQTAKQKKNPPNFNQIQLPPPHTN
jgi:hypothetical protein